MTSLLFDEYLSHKLPSKLVDVYPGSATFVTSGCSALGTNGSGSALPTMGS